MKTFLIDTGDDTDQRRRTFHDLECCRIREDCPDMDCIEAGEGEELMPDYLGYLNDPGSVAGLAEPRDVKILENFPRPLLRDPDQFPYPDRASLPIDFIESLPQDVPVVVSLHQK